MKQLCYFKNRIIFIALIFIFFPVSAKEQHCHCKTIYIGAGTGEVQQQALFDRPAVIKSADIKKYAFRRCLDEGYDFIHYYSNISKDMSYQQTGTEVANTDEVKLGEMKLRELYSLIKKTLDGEPVSVQAKDYWPKGGYGASEVFHKCLKFFGSKELDTYTENVIATTKGEVTK